MGVGVCLRGVPVVLAGVKAIELPEVPRMRTEKLIIFFAKKGLAWPDATVMYSACTKNWEIKITKNVEYHKKVLNKSIIVNIH